MGIESKRVISFDAAIYVWGRVATQLALGGLIAAITACGGLSSAVDGGPGDSKLHNDDGRGDDASSRIDAPPSGPNACAARDCGTDGSGGSCGDCGGSFTCDTDDGLCIPPGTTPNVTFQGACWFVCAADEASELDCTAGARYQALQFDLQTAFPIEATLYYNNNCNPDDGTDNLNDTGAATPTEINLMWFIHHPDVRPSSAVWWFGTNSTGCLDYTNAPDCQ